MDCDFARMKINFRWLKGNIKLQDTVVIFRWSPAQYLIDLVFLQDNSLRRHSGYPWNGGGVIPVVRKVRSASQTDFLSSASVF